MKKFLLMAVVAFGMLATACSKDEVAQPVGGEESVVTFTVEAPVMATRYGEGTTATQLSWAVYDKTHNLLFQSTEPTVMSGLKATVEIPFVNGMAYNILFWAESANSPYSVNWAEKSVAYKNASQLANDENYDAFFCYFTELDAVTGPVNEDVELKRPFAQLNIITNDATEAAQSGLTVDQVSVEISEGCDKFNLANGEGIKAAAGTKITFSNATKVANDHLAVNYLFTGGQKSLVNVTFAYTDGDLTKGGDASRSMEFAAVPVQRNYRTNIVGSLLTSDGKFNIEVKPGFDGEQGVVDGNNYIKVATAEELNAALNDSTVDEIILEEDIDLSEILTIGVPTRAETEAVVRNLTIDGNGKTLTSSAGRAINVSGVDGVTIKNLTIVCSGERAINIIQNATNVKIENVTATAANYTVNVASSAPNAVVDIKDSTLNGLCTVNVASAGAKVTVDGCTVNCNDNNTTVGEAYAAICLNKDAENATITVTNSEINVPEGSDSKSARNGAPNGTITIDGSTEGVCVMVAAITYPGSNYYYSFETLEEAVEFAKEGDTITLIRDIEQEDGVLITDKNITIDLNNKSFTVSEGASTNNRNFKINGESVVTIKNGTLVAEGELTSGAYGTIRTEDTATVTLNDVELYSYRGYGLNVKALDGTKVTINDSEIYSQYSGGVEAAGGEIVLSNVTIDQNGVYSGAAWCSVAIGVNGGGKVVVNSGTYSAETIAEDANAAQGTWVAYVMSSGGTLEINGGTFTGGDSATANAANACGIICADKAAVVNIYGGTFNAQSAILDMRNNVGSLPNPIATLYGGDFSHNPTESGLYGSNLINVAEGKVAVQQSNGRWTLVDGVATAEALAEAVAVGGNVVLGADITVDEPVIIPEGKTVILNMNGKTLSAADEANKYALNNHGTLTITGNGVVNARGIYNGYSSVDDNHNSSAKLIIENGTFNAMGTNGGACIFNYGIVEVNGGQFTSIGGYSLNNQNGSSMTIMDATVTGGIYNLGDTLTINGGKIATTRGGYTHAIYHNGGVLTVNDGEFEGNGNEVIHANSCVANINGGSFKKVGQTSYLLAGSQMTIYNGTFVAHESNPAAHPVRPDVIVKGGKFNYKHTNIADGYKIIDNGDGTWSVVAE